MELLKIEHKGEMWEVKAAVDGKVYPEFWEPVSRSYDWPEDQFLAHLKEQAISMAEYCRSQT